MPNCAHNVAAFSVLCCSIYCSAQVCYGKDQLLQQPCVITRCYHKFVAWTLELPKQICQNVFEGMSLLCGWILFFLNRPSGSDFRFNMPLFILWMYVMSGMQRGCCLSFRNWKGFGQIYPECFWWLRGWIWCSFYRFEYTKWEWFVKCHHIHLFLCFY